MLCQNSELEIETIVYRIKGNDIKLQPDFQRGEIWSPSKQKKLIDSLLRGWKIPPIHFVEGENAIDEVLDGQQRLVAIKDFFDNKFTVDGNIEPIDISIQEFDGFKYNELPIEIQRQFKKYTINIIRLTKFKPEEPAELFYRLNQPMTLTSAEQRNAYIGNTRDQVKNLVVLFEKMGANKETIGFSNSRLAYDEIISKYCYCVETKTLRKKITANDVSDKYRKDIPFNIDTIIRVEGVIKYLMQILEIVVKEKLFMAKLSKATLYSWLVFIKPNCMKDEKVIADILFKFEAAREYVKGKLGADKYMDFIQWYKSVSKRYTFMEVMLNMFNQRSSMGSTDALSIIYRDIIINLFAKIISDQEDGILDFANMCFKEKENMAYVLDEIYRKYEWGDNY